MGRRGEIGLASIENFLALAQEDKVNTRKAQEATMGQRIGKASLIEEMKPFANLSAEAIQECWDKFNEVAEGFGISLDIFKSVCSVTIE